VQLSLGYTVVVGNEHHTFVVATDLATGQQIFTRAGPSAKGSGPSSTAAGSSSAGGSVIGSSGNGSSGGLGFGTIYAQGGVWNDNSLVDKPSATVAMQPLGTTTLTLAEIQGRMTEFQNVTNGNSLTYFPLGPNSNSYAFTFVESLGIPRPQPVMPAPGSSMGSPSPNLTYIKQPIPFVP
jgi:hypothetical protein